METELDLKSIIDLLRRQLWLILITAFAFVALAALYTYSITPKFTATALVLVDTSTKNLLENDTRSSNSSMDNARIESEVDILKSDRILIEVIRSNDLISDDEFGIKVRLRDRLLSFLRIPLPPLPTGDQALGSVLTALKSAVTVNRNGLTYLISVGVVSKDPEKAAKLANAVTESYIKEQIGSKISSTLVARDTIQRRVAAANSAIIENEKSFDTYITQNIDRLEKEVSSSGLTSLRTQLDRLNTERTNELGRIEKIQRSLAEQDFGVVAATLGTQALLELQKQREDLAEKITASGQDQASIDLRAQLAQIDKSLESQALAQLDGLRKSASGFQDQANTVRQQLRATVLESNLPPEVLAEIFNLQQSSEIARNQYQSLLSKLQELDAQSDLQLPDSRVVSAALVPTRPSFPNGRLILALALVAALGLGVGLAILREYFIGGFTSESQIESVLRSPLSAVCPLQSAEDQARGSSGNSVADLMITAPLSHFSESVRRLRLTLDQPERRKPGSKPEDSEGSIIMVSSALPGEGKSTMALSLARAYALTGQKTLLIDCDLRKPSISKHLALEPSHDFVDYLRQDRAVAGLSSLTMRDPLSNLTVLLGGRRSDIPTDELVMSEKMARILSGARKHFDYIVLDTPPVEPVVDGLYLARHADMIAFVVKWGSTPQSSAKRAIAALKDNKNTTASIVTILNQKERTKRSRNSGYSGYYTE